MLASALAKFYVPGALYIGATVAAVLFGITNLQTVIYYKRYPDDWWVYRYSVALLWVLDTLHVTLSTHALYYYLIDKVDIFRSLVGENAQWSFKLQFGINVLIVVYVQGVYAIRLWKRSYFRVVMVTIVTAHIDPSWTLFW
ncbi:uncharacterized protein EV420DRAFT_1688878 [Desarmillaria tabescens]|uniref:Uncharacterized protein n=1 Tax=Armillaria tabescens TaxID=1929756 RepID=A0AA39N4E3_ARMTA|nr:uncharacterized protein EV420DRAFT_1688878 [Desarmillaria tabescens]KAK0457517.1 hypothetical protein EV420DRAFT_1688878 [Desarmillaria tabescens]